MSRYTKVVIETDSKGRMSIACEDDEGCGHGHRLAGSKYVDDVVTGNYAKPAIRVELDERDVAEIRSYLRIWDEIQERKKAAAQPTEG